MALLTTLVHCNGRAIDDDNIENNVSMAYCIPHAVDTGKWQLVDVDDLIAHLFDMHSVSGGFRTMYLYVGIEMSVNLAQTPLAGRTINTQSSRASAQGHYDNSTRNSMMNPPDQKNPLMKDILSDISDHEDDFLYGNDEDEELEAVQPSQEMPNVGEVAGEVQVLVASQPSYHVLPNSQFSDINWEAMDGATEFPEFRSDDGWNPDSKN
ncbi:hypothetical protein PIB30_017007 [Stylosanthes scabra]|uniref:Uncharacterized protein n=1 Tax=Stylosanthes scabra TaxID=79078 RepID=A0ABU6Q864_9FABA|nr:hypothetical protein [Stylosanthes scabra]